MTQTFYEDVVVDGGADVTQLTVQGHSTQDEPLQVWEDSSGDELAQITGDGRFQIGSFDGGAMATDDSLIEVHRDEADITKPKRGLHLLGEISGTLSEVVQWAVQELVLKGTGGISALHSAVRVKLLNENTGSATAAELRAGDFEIINAGGGEEQAVGEITGIRVAVTNQGAGFVDDAVGVDVIISDSGEDVDSVYGVRVGDVNQGSSDNYAIHTSAGTVHLGDLSADDGLVRSVSGDLVVLKDNLSASATPTTGDDSGDGYAVGSRWIDTTNDKEYVCVDATVGDAVWIETTQSGGDSLLPGTILIFAGVFAPPGYLLCDGSEKQIASYPNLFPYIGTTYGGDGRNTFKVPDLRSRFPVGVGQGTGLSIYYSGSVGGEETHQLTIAEMPAHTHLISSATNALAAGTNYPSVGTVANQSSSTGDDSPHENRPPYLALNFIIKT